MHRLFLALPVPPDPAQKMAAWSAAELKDLRAIPSENLHVTLLFFGPVDAARRDDLVARTAETGWEPLPARIGVLASFGRSAVALRLTVPEAPLTRLRARLVPALVTTAGETTTEADASPSNPDDPLGRMAVFLNGSESVGKASSLAPHVTVARRKAALPPGLLERRFPPLDFSLDRLVLYESHTEPSGARYRELAQATVCPPGIESP